jgi:hypothetical protein
MHRMTLALISLPPLPLRVQMNLTTILVEPRQLKPSFQCSVDTSQQAIANLGLLVATSIPIKMILLLSSPKKG